MDFNKYNFYVGALVGFIIWTNMECVLVEGYLTNDVNWNLWGKYLLSVTSSIVCSSQIRHSRNPKIHCCNHKYSLLHLFSATRYRWHPHNLFRVLLILSSPLCLGHSVFLSKMLHEFFTSTQSTCNVARPYRPPWFQYHFNPLALELDIYSLARHLCKMWIFYEPRRVTLGNTRHFVEE